MKKIIFSLLFLILITITTIGFIISKGESTEIPTPETYITGVEGSVLIKNKNSSSWEKASVDEKINEGDSIKTGKDSLAIINFYDNSTSRIDENSEILITKLFIDNKNFSKTKVNFFVEAGKVWSRIVQLLDAEAEFEATSNNTVATVRGTTFDFDVSENGTTNINAVESVIKITNTITNESVNLLEGNEAISENEDNETFSTSSLYQKSIVINKIPKDTLDSNWFTSNKKGDKEFEDVARKKYENLNAQIAGILPDSKLYGIKIFTEKIKIAMTANSDKKNNLISRYINKRLAESQELERQGKSSLAEKTVKKWDKEITNRKNKTGILDSNIKNQINLLKVINKNVLPETKIHNLKEKIEETEIKNTSDNEKLFLKLKQLEERLNEVKKIKEDGRDIEFENFINKTKEQLFRNKTILDQEQRELINLKEEIIFNKERFERKIEEPQKSIEEPNEVENESSIKIDLNQLMDPEKILEMKQNYERLQKELSSTTKQLEDALETSSSTEENLEENDNNNTILDGETNTDNNPSLINESNQNIEENTNTEIQPKPIIELSKIEISAPRYNITAGKTLQFTAYAIYNNGTNKDISNLCRWSVSGDIGTISINGLLKTDEDGGKGIVSTTFIENSKTYSAKSPEITALTINF